MHCTPIHIGLGYKRLRPAWLIALQLTPDFHQDTPPPPPPSSENVFKHSAPPSCSIPCCTRHTTSAGSTFLCYQCSYCYGRDILCMQLLPMVPLSRTSCKNCIQNKVHFWYIIYVHTDNCIHNNRKRSVGSWGKAEFRVNIERIAGVFGKSGGLLDQIGFVTNKGRIFGPYGGCGGGNFHVNSCHVRGIFGRSAGLIDSIGFFCSRVV